jgi:predicted NAD/FAD-binding protein
MSFETDSWLPLDQIVCNPPTYPNFLAFLKEKKVRTIPTTMTFSVSRDKGAFEWAGENLFTIFVQPKNLLNPRIWRMLLDVMRFNLFGLDLITDGSGKGKKQGVQGKSTGQTKKMDEDEAEEEMSIGEYLDRGGYGDGFKEDYLLVSSLLQSR